MERRCWLRVGPRSVRAPSADPHQPLSVRDLLLSLSSPADRAAADDSDRTRCRRRQALEVSPALRAQVGRARDQARRSPPGRAPGNARSSCTGLLAGSVPGSCSISSNGLPPAFAARACVCVGVSHCVVHIVYGCNTSSKNATHSDPKRAQPAKRQRRAVGALLKPITARRARRERDGRALAAGFVSPTAYIFT